MATMIATYDYVLYSNDTEWLHSVWPAYQSAMTYIVSKIDKSTGLLDVKGHPAGAALPVLQAIARSETC